MVILLALVSGNMLRIVSFLKRKLAPKIISPRNKYETAIRIWQQDYVERRLLHSARHNHRKRHIDKRGLRSSRLVARLPEMHRCKLKGSAQVLFSNQAQSNRNALLPCTYR